MKKLLTVTLSVAAVLSVLTLSAAIALALWFNPNEYKPQLVAWVKSKTGRELMVPDKIELTFLPRLGISTGRLQVMNRPEFSSGPFARIDQGAIRIQWLPLLSGNIRIDRIKLKGIHLYLSRNEQGKNNWFDLESNEPAIAVPNAESAKSSESGNIMARVASVAAIAGIDIEQAHVHWDDRQHNNRYDLDELSLETGRLALGQPVAIRLSFLLKPPDEQSLGTLSFVTTLTIAKKFEAFELSQPVLTYSNSAVLASVGRVKPPLVELKADAVIFNRMLQSLTTKGMRMRAGDLHADIEAAGQRLAEAPEIQWALTIAEFNPSVFLREMNYSLPTMQESRALTRFSAQFKGSATAVQLAVQQFSGRLDDTHFNGSATIDRFADPSLVFDWRLDSLNANHYLPPETKAKKALATPAVAVAAVLAKIPNKTLKSVQINGKITLDRLDLHGLTMRGLHLKVKSDRGRVSAEEGITELYRGSYRGTTDLTLAEGLSELSAQEQIDSVRLAPLLKGLYGKARVSGTLKASARWQGEGRNVEELKSNVSGQMNFLLNQGAISGFNLQKTIDGLKNLKNSDKGIILASPQEQDQTFFSEASGNATLRDGILSLRDFLASSPQFRVDGQGSADLKSEAIDGRLTARIVKKPATATEPEQFHSTPVVVKISGSFARPVYSLDVAALLTDKNKAKIRKFIDKKQHKIDKLLDKLNKKLGPGTGELLQDLL